MSCSATAISSSSNLRSGLSGVLLPRLLPVLIAVRATRGISGPTVSPPIAKALFVTAGGGRVRSRWSFLPIARAPGLAVLTIDNHKWGRTPDPETSVVRDTTGGGVSCETLGNDLSKWLWCRPTRGPLGNGRHSSQKFLPAGAGDYTGA